MRKVTIPAVKCECCGHTKTFEQYEEFCDVCGKKVPHEYPLKIQLFDVNHVSGVYEDIMTCSWACVKTWLETNKEKALNCDFLELPFLVNQSKNENRRYAEDAEGFYKLFMNCVQEHQGEKKQ